ncbi:MAG: hypothetical protein AABY86_14640, partial [Bdellovibrionota bacterium]
LPADDGATGELLRTDGSGVLSWVSPSTGTVTNVATGSGLTGGPISTTGTISIGSGGVTSTHIFDGTIADADVSATANITATKLGTGLISNTEFNYLDGVTSAIQTQFSGKEPSIGTGATTTYWRGDKSWQTLDTTVVTEGTNLYYTDARARTAAVADSIADAITNIAPSQNAVFDALALKADSSALTNYVLKAGDTMSGSLSGPGLTMINQGAVVLKELTANGTDGISIQSPASIAAGSGYVMTLPATVGAAGQVLSTDGAGLLSWIAVGGTGTVTNVATGSGLTGGPITTTGTISIASGGVTSTHIFDGTIADADVSATANITATKLGTGAVDNTEFNYLDGVTSAIQTQFSGKEPSIGTGATTTYWRGDKSWQTLNTTVVTEGTNLYYTDARARTAAVADSIADA